VVRRTTGTAEETIAFVIPSVGSLWTSVADGMY
jgi:hypothetical protein